MGFFISIYNMTRNHRSFYFFCIKTKWYNLFISSLFFKFGKINCFSQDSRWSSSFQSSSSESKSVKAFSKSISCTFTNTPTRCIILTNKNSAAQKSSCCQNYRTHWNYSASFCYNSRHFLTHAASSSFSFSLMTTFSWN